MNPGIYRWVPFYPNKNSQKSSNFELSERIISTQERLKWDLERTLDQPNQNQPKFWIKLIRIKRNPPVLEPSQSMWVVTQNELNNLFFMLYNLHALFEIRSIQRIFTRFCLFELSGTHLYWNDANRCGLWRKTERHNAGFGFVGTCTRGNWYADAICRNYDFSWQVNTSVDLITTVHTVFSA